jgi:acetoacetyl-CoA synthetase
MIFPIVKKAINGSLVNEDRDPIVWNPPAIFETRAGDFIRVVNQQFDLNIDGYASLHRWSVTEIGPFWHTLFETSGLIYDGDLSPVVESDRLWPRPQWFSNVRINYAENMLKNRTSAPAIIYYSEHQPVQTITFSGLSDQVAQLSDWMRRRGIGIGDVVAGFVPNCPEALVVMLAAAAVGAVWTSCSPDSGTQFAVDRFNQTVPKLLVAVDGYVYDDKIFTIGDKIQELRDGLPTLKSTLIISRIPGTIFDDSLVFYDSIVSVTNEVPELVFERLTFSHALYILYSSGTTGKPKCLAHSAGGSLLQHIKEHRLQCDLRPLDRLMYYTTTSWMMWNWLVSGLASDITVVLFEGKPDPAVVWEFVKTAGVTAFGTSASWISLCQKTKVGPTPAQVASIALLMSTGSALLRDHFDYIYSEVKSDIQVSSISGGTDIVSCFALGGPVPVRRGRLQCAGLGMAVEVWDDNAQRVFGVQGELVCTQPFPCMPVYFLNDPNSEKYHSAYFERFDGFWTHGDSAIQYEDGSLEIVGRSDSTIKHHGVRVGTGDLYNILEGIAAIRDSLVVGRRVGDDEDIVVFLVLKSGEALDSTLKREIRLALTAQSPWFKPDAVFEVTDIPVTTNGKKSEILVKNLLNGVPITNLSVIKNPGCLSEYQEIAKQMADADALKRNRSDRKEMAGPRP